MSLSIKPTASRYDPIQSEEETNGEIPAGSRKSLVVSFSRRTVIIYHVVWLLIVTVTVALTGTWFSSAAHSNCDTFRKEDFAPARKAIKIKQTTFTEASTFNGSNHPPRKFRSDMPLYVGDPNAALEQNWSELLDHQYFYISEQEAKTAWGEGYQKYWKDEATNSYRAGVGVLHSLHCLNIIRKEIYKEHYRHRPYEGLVAELQKYHVDHCMDMIRQSIQCSSDLTPIPVIWYEPISGKQSVDSEHVHTCRNIRSIRDWVTSKVDESRALQQDIEDRAIARAI